jgi:ribonuclease BN (tRNA processing enzyme)
VSDGSRSFAYSGDTEWTDKLLSPADGADAFVVECYAGLSPTRGHLDLSTLEQKLPTLRSRRTIVTHLGPAALALKQLFLDAGLIVADDGYCIDL